VQAVHALLDPMVHRDNKLASGMMWGDLTTAVAASPWLLSRPPSRENLGPARRATAVMFEADFGQQEIDETSGDKPHASGPTRHSVTANFQKPTASTRSTSTALNQNDLLGHMGALRAHRLTYRSLTNHIPRVSLDLGGW
jgi:hypothetical protein